MFQTASADEENVALVDTTSAISVQPLPHRKEELEETIEPPIPKVSCHSLLLIGEEVSSEHVYIFCYCYCLFVGSLHMSKMLQGFHKVGTTSEAPENS